MNMTTFDAGVEHVLFANLSLSDLNPRTVVSEDDIAVLADNIAQVGLIQNLAGLRRKDGGVEIVAGGRRYRALRTLQDDPRFQSVPVLVTDDPETARYWASSENHLRTQPHPADEINEYGTMRAAGIEVHAIAIAFGVTEANVQRRLKLAGLPFDVLTALKANEITLGNAAAFTVTDDPDLTTEVLAQVRGAGCSDHRIRQMLKPRAVKGSDRRIRFVGHDTYVAAGGRTTADLFEDVIYYEDITLLDDLFARALQAAADQTVAEGWSWAEVTTESYVGYWEIDQRAFARVYPIAGDLTDDQTERYEALAELAEADVLDEAGDEELAQLQAILDGDYSDAERGVSGVIVYVAGDGCLQHCAGLIRNEDRAAAEATGVLAPSAQKPDQPKSPISAKLADDLARIALGAKQNALLNDPDLLLDLLAYQLSHALWTSKPFGIRCETVSNWPSTEDQGYVLDPRLAEVTPRDMWGTKDLAASFRAFRRKGKAHAQGELTRFLAGLFQGGDQKLDALIAKEVAPDIRAVWTPTAANFFKRVGGPYLNALWRDLLDLSEDHPTATTFAKLKKQEKTGRLEKLFADPQTRTAYRVTDDQAAKIDAWLPEGMS